MSFPLKLRQRPEDKCSCWDCLRAEGLTPPLSLRNKHLPLHTDKEPKGPGYDFREDR